MVVFRLPAHIVARAHNSLAATCIAPEDINPQWRPVPIAFSVVASAPNGSFSIANHRAIGRGVLYQHRDTHHYEQNVIVSALIIPVKLNAPDSLQEHYVLITKALCLKSELQIHMAPEF